MSCSEVCDVRRPICVEGVAKSNGDELTRPPSIEGSEFKERIIETPSGRAPDYNCLGDLTKDRSIPNALAKMGSPQMSDKSDQVILPPPATVHSQNQSPTAERGGSSENGSRGFEPEGSVEMSPPSESSSPPSYLKWTESINYLLEDGEGAALFRKYLDEQNLEHMTFWAACNGLKLEQMEEKRKAKMIKLIFKKFVRSGSSGLKCITSEVRNGIQAKIEAGGESSMDANLFDGAQHEVVQEMERTFYHKFFESDYYLNYIRSMQSNGDFSDANSSKPCSGTHSSSSSVSGRHGGSSSNPAHCGTTSSSLVLPQETQSFDPNQWGGKTKMTQSRSDSSGFSDSSTPLLITPTAQISSSSVIPGLSSLGGDPSSVGSLASNLALTSLQTVEEDSELNLGTNQEKVIHQGNKQHTLTLSTLERSQRSRIRTSAGITPEVFPSKEGSSGSTNHPYHAHSSIWNPVSRNDSEIQSQSSGAMGGDTTDDGNYSSFTDMSSTFSEQAIRSIEEAKHKKLKERLRKEQEIKRTAEQNRVSMDPINNQKFRPTNQGRLPPQPQNPEQFFKQVKAKLQAYIDEQKQRQSLHHKLKQIDAGTEVGGGSSTGSAVAGGAVAAASSYSMTPSVAASSSQLMMANRTASVSHLFNSSYNRSLRDDGESDQSILDEHCSRVFETTPSRTPPNEKSSRKNTTMNLSQDSVSSSKARKATSSYNWTERRHAGYGTLNTRGSGRTDNSAAATNTFAPRPTTDFSDHPMPAPSAPPFTSGSEFNYHGARSAAPSMAGAGNMAPPHQIPFGRQPDDRVQKWVHQTMSTTRQPPPPPHHQQSYTMRQHQPQTGYQHHQGWGSTSDDEHSRRFVRASAASSGKSKTSPRNSGRAKQQQQQLSQSMYNTGSASVYGGASVPTPDQGVESTKILYKFPSMGGEPLLYKINFAKNVFLLSDIKGLCPRKGHYRYFFKTLEDDMTVNEEISEDHAPVPFFEGKVIVECRDD